MRLFIVVALIFSPMCLSNTTYNCVVKKARAFDNPRDFGPFRLEILGRNTIHILKKIDIMGQKITMDEQFLNVKPVNCPIPGKAGKKFASAGLEESANGYRLDYALFLSKPPYLTKVGFVLDIDRSGLICKPAIYECTKI
jgi:hypothetical protein